MIWRKKESELEIMGRMKQILEELPNKEARDRVLRWLMDVSELERGSDKESSRALETEKVKMSNGDFQELFQKVSSKSESEKVLVVGYYLQTRESKEVLRAEEINLRLRNYGHGVRNVTAALRELVNKKPQLVLTFGKSGKSQQAHKKYKLTIEGMKRAEALLSKDI